MIKTDTKIYDGIEVRAQKPMDVRTIVTYREDLYKLSTWPHDTYIDEDGNEHHTIYMREGMTVMVTGDKSNPIFESYVLVDLSKILDPGYAGWKFAGNMNGGGGIGLTGNIDGGNAAGRYTQSQIINCGNASSRGETSDE